MEMVPCKSSTAALTASIPTPRPEIRELRLLRRIRGKRPGSVSLPLLPTRSRRDRPVFDGADRGLQGLGEPDKAVLILDYLQYYFISLFILFQLLGQVLLSADIDEDQLIQVIGC